MKLYEVIQGPFARCHLMLQLAQINLQFCGLRGLEQRTDEQNGTPLHRTLAS